jgi:hypothetical protein
VPEAEDEYDSYVDGVNTLLARRAARGCGVAVESGRS